MIYQTPEVRDLAKMLSMIVGASATAKVAPAASGPSPEYVAIYVNRADEVVATCSCALSTAAALGCALSMIPAGGAQAMVEDGELSSMAKDNFYEVMNIFSSLMMNDKSAHLKLSEVVHDAGKRLQAEGSQEAVFNVVLAAYGPGEVVFDFT